VCWGFCGLVSVVAIALQKDKVIDVSYKTGFRQLAASG
jgi:hypothetical protein